jgi:hypothetical protein
LKVDQPPYFIREDLSLVDHTHIQQSIFKEVTDWGFISVIISRTDIPPTPLQACAGSHVTVAREMHRKYNLPNCGKRLAKFICG